MKQPKLNHGVKLRVALFFNENPKLHVKRNGGRQECASRGIARGSGVTLQNPERPESDTDITHASDAGKRSSRSNLAIILFNYLSTKQARPSALEPKKIITGFLTLLYRLSRINPLEGIYLAGKSPGKESSSVL